MKIPCMKDNLVITFIGSIKDNHGNIVSHAYSGSNGICSAWVEDEMSPGMFDSLESEEEGSTNIYKKLLVALEEKYIENNKPRQYVEPLILTSDGEKAPDFWDEMGIKFDSS